MPPRTHEYVANPSPKPKPKDLQPLPLKLKVAQLAHLVEFHPFKDEVEDTRAEYKEYADVLVAKGLAIYCSEQRSQSLEEKLRSIPTPDSIVWHQSKRQG
jgi:hypothetical protein